MMEDYELNTYDPNDNETHYGIKTNLPLPLSLRVSALHV